MGVVGVTSFTSGPLRHFLECAGHSAVPGCGSKGLVVITDRSRRR